MFSAFGKGLGGPSGAVFSILIILMFFSGSCKRGDTPIDLVLAIDSSPSVASTQNSSTESHSKTRLTADSDPDRKVGDSVEVCWSTDSAESCTLSILHASGEGDIYEVAPADCRMIVIEVHTLVELFCSGAEGHTHEILNLEGISP